MTFRKRRIELTNIEVAEMMRFSLRHLFWLVALTGVFLASWNLLRPRAIADVQRASGGWPPAVVAPYLLRVSKSDNITVRDSYHAWLLGNTIRLPFGSEYPEPNSRIITVRPRIILQPEEELPRGGFDLRR